MTEDITNIIVNILISYIYNHEIINNLNGYKYSINVRNLEVYENVKKEFKVAEDIKGYFYPSIKFADPLKIIKHLTANMLIFNTLYIFNVDNINKDIKDIKIITNLTRHIIINSLYQHFISKRPKELEDDYIKIFSKIMKDFELREKEIKEVYLSFLKVKDT